MKKYPLFIISWCSWVGKNTIWEEISKILWNKLKRIKTLTSRESKPAENHPWEYRFISRKEFEDKIDKWEMFEWTVTDWNLYWSTNHDLEEIVKKWLVPVYLIDVKWHSYLKSEMTDKFDIISIFMLPSSFEELEERLEARWTETEDRILLRLQKAKDEIEHIAEFDYLIINNDLEQCAKEITYLIESKIKNYGSPDIPMIQR
ncbi:MAG: hypothetical protein ACD_2C00239G0003 [uncultured bacterium (gcode 4)]|uniref:Guanylate kinase-like domain-containing protein n=1 Tax=uncultured bacterium (gcode 4) TaxID=1234023 RepID=K2FD55_9BACT|nr:MAG: hypothetical protein ACD_2C00239G0003 [uncultured bacterium (gcode 4)]